MSSLIPKILRQGFRPAHLTALRSVAIVAAFVLMMVCSILLLNDGSKTGLALGGIVVAAPVAVYVACRRPLLFPFALYVATNSKVRNGVKAHWYPVRCGDCVLADQKKMHSESRCAGYLLGRCDRLGGGDAGMVDQS